MANYILTLAGYCVPALAALLALNVYMTAVASQHPDDYPSTRAGSIVQVAFTIVFLVAVPVGTYAVAREAFLGVFGPA